MCHFTDMDLQELVTLAENKAMEPVAREDFEVYVLLRAIPKIVEDLFSKIEVNTFDLEPLAPSSRRVVE